jgi:hypothetical protein
MLALPCCFREFSRESSLSEPTALFPDHGSPDSSDPRISAFIRGKALPMSRDHGDLGDPGGVPPSFNPSQPNQPNLA